MITWTLSCIECCKTFYLENLDFPLNWSILNAIDSFVKIFYFFVFFTRQIRANFCRFFLSLGIFGFASKTFISSTIEKKGKIGRNYESGGRLYQV